MQMMAFLLGIPWLVVLGCVLLGAWLLVTPRRIGTLLADGFGFQSRFASHAFVKVLLLRLVGAGVIGFAIFLAANNMPLDQAVQRWQPAPQGANPCGPIFHPRNAHCDQVHH